MIDLQEQTLQIPFSHLIHGVMRDIASYVAPFRQFPYRVPSGTRLDVGMAAVDLDQSNR